MNERSDVAPAPVPPPTQPVAALPPRAMTSHVRWLPDLSSIPKDLRTNGPQRESGANPVWIRVSAFRGRSIPADSPSPSVTAPYGALPASESTGDLLARADSLRL